MATIGSLIAVLGVNTKSFDKGLNKAVRNFKDLGQELSKVGKTLSVAVTAPIVGLGVAAVKSSGELDKSFSDLKGVMGDFLKTLGTDIVQSLNLKEVFKSLNDTIVSLTNAWKNLTPETKKTVIQMALVAAAVGPLVLGVAKLIGGLAGAVKGIGAFLAVGGGWLTLIVGAAVAVVILVEELGGLKNALDLTTSAFRAMTEDDPQKALQAWVDFLDAKGKTGGVSKKIKEIIDAIGEIKKALSGLSTAAGAGEVAALGTTLDNLKTKLQDARLEAGLMSQGMDLLDRNVMGAEASVRVLEEALKSALAAGVADNSDLIQQLADRLEAARGQLQLLKDKAAEAATSFSASFTAMAESMKVVATTVVSSIQQIVTTVIQGIGDAVATAIVQGGNVQAIFLTLLKNVAQAVISTLVQMALQYLIFNVLMHALAAEELSTKVATHAGVSAAAAAAAAFETFGLLGFAVAPGAATGAAALTTSLAAAGAAIGRGVAIAGAAEGAIVTGPTLLNVGETPASRPEVIAPLRKLKGMMGPMTVLVELDGQRIMRSHVKSLPKFLRVRGITK